MRALLGDDSDEDTNRNKMKSRPGKGGKRDMRLINPDSERSDKMGSSKRSSGKMKFGEKVRQ